MGYSLRFVPASVDGFVRVRSRPLAPDPGKTESRAPRAVFELSTKTGGDDGTRIRDLIRDSSTKDEARVTTLASFRIKYDRGEVMKTPGNLQYAGQKIYGKGKTEGVGECGVGLGSNVQAERISD